MSNRARCGWISQHPVQHLGLRTSSPRLRFLHQVRFQRPNWQACDHAPVLFSEHHSATFIDQVSSCVRKLVYIEGMKLCGRLVLHIQHLVGPLRCKTQPLQFTCRERGLEISIPLPTEERTLGIQGFTAGQRRVRNPQCCPPQGRRPVQAVCVQSSPPTPGILLCFCKQHVKRREELSGL